MVLHQNVACESQEDEAADEESADGIEIVVEEKAPGELPLEEVYCTETPGTESLSPTGNYLLACQYLTAALGGELEISSELGDGLRVRAWFPGPEAEALLSTEDEGAS